MLHRRHLIPIPLIFAALCVLHVSESCDLNNFCPGDVEQKTLTEGESVTLGPPTIHGPPFTWSKDCIPMIEKTANFTITNGTIRSSGIYRRHTLWSSKIWCINLTFVPVQGPGPTPAQNVTHPPSLTAQSLKEADHTGGIIGGAVGVGLMFVGIMFVLWKCGVFKTCQRRGQVPRDAGVENGTDHYHRVPSQASDAVDPPPGAG